MSAVLAIHSLPAGPLAMRARPGTLGTSLDQRPIGRDIAEPAGLGPRRERRQRTAHKRHAGHPGTQRLEPRLGASCFLIVSGVAVRTFRPTDSPAARGAAAKRSAAPGAASPPPPVPGQRIRSCRFLSCIRVSPCGRLDCYWQRGAALPACGAAMFCTHEFALAKSRAVTHFLSYITG
jgi:hypothetical protein